MPTLMQATAEAARYLQTVQDVVSSYRAMSPEHQREFVRDFPTLARYTAALSELTAKLTT